MNLAFDDATQKTTIISTKAFLETDDEELENDFFNEKDDSMTIDGLKSMTNAFLVGLNTAIQDGDDSGVWKKEQHYEYITKRLWEIMAMEVTIERGFEAEKEEKHN